MLWKRATCIERKNDPSEQDVNPGAFVDELGVGQVVADVGIPISTEGDVVEGVVEQLTERQHAILRLIGKSVAEGVVETAESMARKLKVSSRTVQRELSRLQKMKRLRRKGADSNGDWEVLGRM